MPSDDWREVDHAACAQINVWYVQAEAALERVRKLHWAAGAGAQRWCVACSFFSPGYVAWPCPTIAAVGVLATADAAQEATDAE